ncbi:hypothetical protein SSX86_029145 [Deinandra increscens subsp. villosa]|uniref:Uncharacterized protein n=1 Tax=Deinandra increscens subsp. villosa TaxID=3103831 RepID=A0AAP0GKA3_9ASTR
MNPPPNSLESPTTPLLLSTTTTTTAAADETPATSNRFLHHYRIPKTPSSASSYRSLSVLTGHDGSVSSLAICGEFILSASHAKDIIVWQHPDLRQFTKFGQGDGAVKAVITVGNRVFTAHQDSRIRVWKVSRSSENIFKLVHTLPTTKDYLGKFMKQSNYVQTRRHHKRLWIEHADSISCLSVSNGLIYSGSWDKTLKVWRISDLKCLESIKAHDDAINSLVAVNRGIGGIVYSASADGKIKAWGRRSSSSSSNKTEEESSSHLLKGILEGHKDVSMNSVVVSDGGSVVYGGGSDGYVMGWLGSEDLDSWKLVCEVKAHEMAILCMCIRGGILCSGSSDKTICIWKREVKFGLTKIGVVKGHEGPVKCLQASPNSIGGGFLLYSGGLDKSIRVWWVPCYYDEGDTQDSNSFCGSTRRMIKSV